MKYAYDYYCPSSNFRSLMVIKISSFFSSLLVVSPFKRREISRWMKLKSRDKKCAHSAAAAINSNKSKRVKRVTRSLPIQVSLHIRDACCLIISILLMDCCNCTALWMNAHIGEGNETLKLKKKLGTDWKRFEISQIIYFSAASSRVSRYGILYFMNERSVLL